MNNYMIRVAPEVLASAAEDVLGKAVNVENTFSEMQTKMKQTASFWNGEAAERHRSLFEDELPAMEALAARFKMHAEKLRQIAGNYTEAKAAASEVIEALPNDVIV